MTNDAELERAHRLLCQRYRGRRGVLLGGRPTGSAEASADLEGAELTLSRFLDHAQGRAKFGVYVVDSDDTVSFAIFDVDVTPRDVPNEELLEGLRKLKPCAIALRNALLELGLQEENVLTEFSGVGYHLWLFFDPPVPAARAHALLQRARVLAGYPTVPFRPSLTEDGRGNPRGTVWLPLRINRGFRSAFLPDLAAFDPTSYPQQVDATLLAAARPLDPQTLARALESARTSP